MKPFTPRFGDEDLYGLLSVFPRSIENSPLYAAATAVTAVAMPEVNEFKDETWSDFYLPLKRGRKMIAVPVTITKIPTCKDRLVVSISNRRSMQIDSGQESAPQEYLTLFQEIGKLTPFLQKDASLVKKLVPYDLRTGRIPGKYVMKELMSEEEKESILQKYKEHENQKLKIDKISLDDYLKTVAICYRAAFGRKTKWLSPRQMYERWADGRHGGMLDLTDSSDQDEFKKWYESRDWQGGHPFEIIFSHHNYGISLWPPSTGHNQYGVSVGTIAYVEKYLAMISVLIKQEIPFQTDCLEDTLQYLIGESTFFVNQSGEHSFYYSHSQEEKQKYFPHIIWDPLKIPKWKSE